MKKNQKILSFLLAVLMLCAVLAGCSEGSGSSPAAVDKLMADRKGAGIDKVLTELQSQIDAFIASK